MVALSSQVRFQNKIGTPLYTASLQTFWASLGVSYVFYPKTIYDPLSGRFIFVACAESRSPASSMLLGVSATSDPTAAWYLWQFDGDAADVNWVGYPNIGVNGKWITVTSNMWSIASDSFAGDDIWVIDKTSALDGGATTSTLFFAAGVGGNLVPALTFSAAEDTQYLISAWNVTSTAGWLRLFTITGPAASPGFTATSQVPRLRYMGLEFSRCPPTWLRQQNRDR